MAKLTSTDIYGSLYVQGATTLPRITITETELTPLIVASSALVINLNADLLDGQHGSYYASSASIGNGTLSWTTSTAGATNTTIAASLSGAYSANTSTNRTMSLAIGPALTNLAATMTGASTGLLRKTEADTYTLDTTTYLTGNQSITLTGNVTGTGTTSISTTIASGAVTNDMLAGSIANNKLSNSTISGIALGNNLATLTIGTGLSGTSYNGSTAVTIAHSNSITAGNVGPTADSSPGYGGTFIVPQIYYDAQGHVIVNTTNRTITLPASIDTTYNLMTSTVLGLGKLFSDTVQTVAATAISSTTARTYGLQVNENGQLVVNVPWVNTTYSLISTAEIDNTGSTTARLMSGGRLAHAMRNIVTTTTTLDIGVGATADANTKTINIGTGGLTGSNTLINIGNSLSTTTIGGNLVVEGTTTTINASTLSVSDYIIEIAKDNTVALTNYAGLIIPKYDGTNDGAIIMDSHGELRVGDVSHTGNTITDVSSQPVLTREEKAALTNNDIFVWNPTALRAEGKTPAELGILTGNETITLSGNVTGTGTTSITTTIASGAVTNDMLAGSIANNKLANSTISGIALGGSLATLTIGNGLSGTSYNGSTAITIAHSNSITAGNVGPTANATLTFGGTFAVPQVHYDAQGHVITNTTNRTMTMPSLPETMPPSAHAITAHSATAWRVFYSNATTTAIQQLALGDAGTFLRSAGATAIPTWEIPINTATAVNNILKGSNSGTAITYQPYLVGEKAAGRLYEGSTNPTNDTRLNYDGHFYAKKLYSEGSEVLTSFTEADTLATVTGRGNTTTTAIRIGDTNAPVAERLHLVINQTGEIPNSLLRLENLGASSEASMTYTTATTGSSHWYTGINHGTEYRIGYGNSFTNANNGIIVATTGTISLVGTSILGASTGTLTLRSEANNGRIDITPHGTGTVRLTTLASAGFVKTNASGDLSIDSATYDNYGSWTIKNTSEDTGATVGSGQDVQILGGTNVTTSRSGRNITINSSFTNTATHADGIMKGANSGTQVSYDPYTTNESANAAPRLYTHATVPTGTSRLNLAGYFWATRLHSLGIYGGDTSGGNLTVGSTSHATKGTITLDSNTTVSGNLQVGNSATSNFINFFGTTNDAGGTHTYIGERIYGGSENSELVLFKGNDNEATGSDRIRLIGNNIVFDTYTTATSGTFEAVSTSANVTSKMIIRQDGKVGIGTTSPGQLLDVNGVSRFRDTFYFGATDQIGLVSWSDTSPSRFIIRGQSGYGLSLGSNAASDRIFINTSGDVGIGTTSPGQKLEVIGNTKTRDLIISDTSDATKVTMKYDSTSKSVKFIFA